MLFECVGWLVVFVFDGCSSVIVLVRYCCFGSICCATDMSLYSATYMYVTKGRRRGLSAPNHLCTYPL